MYLDGAEHFRLPLRVQVLVLAPMALVMLGEQLRHGVCVLLLAH
jgi:hypothetical protein